MILDSIGQLGSFLFVDQDLGLGQNVIAVLTVGKIGFGGHPISSWLCPLGILFISLSHVQILIPNLDKLGVDPFARRFAGVKCKLDPTDLRETTLKLRILRHSVLQTLQYLGSWKLREIVSPPNFY